MPAAPTDHLVVLAAGRGTRMDPLTRTLPKVLLPVAGAPLVEHLLRQAKAAGFRRATLVVHEGAAQVRKAFGDGKRLGLRVDYVRQGEPKGTGHAVASLGRRVKEPFVLASGDSYLAAADLKRLRHAKGDTVGGRRLADVQAYGRLDVRGGKVRGVQEKAPGRRAGIANAGAYRFQPSIVEECKRLKPSPRGEIELTDAVTALARQGRAAAFMDLSSWREAGRPWDLLDLQQQVMAGLKGRVDGEVGPRVDIVGEVVVEKGAAILNGTRIEGPAYVAAGAKVGPNAYVRACTSIGEGCHVGAGVEVKNSILGSRTNVPHLSYVGDSILGSGCNLGAGTQVANLKVNDRDVRVHWQGKQWLDTGRRKFGAVLGDGAKTGVNASLNPGTVLAPGARVAAGAAVSGWLEAPKAKPGGRS